MSFSSKNQKRKRHYRKAAELQHRAAVNIGDAFPSQDTLVGIGTIADQRAEGRKKYRQRDHDPDDRRGNAKRLAEGKVTLSRQTTGKLNPRWVETLMGLPVGWTMPSCACAVTIAPTNCGSWGMELFPQPPQSPSQP